MNTGETEYVIGAYYTNNKKVFTMKGTNFNEPVLSINSSENIILPNFNFDNEEFVFYEASEEYQIM